MSTKTTKTPAKRASSKTSKPAKTAAKRPAASKSTSTKQSSKTTAKRASSKPRKAVVRPSQGRIAENGAPAIMALKTYRVEPDLYAEAIRLARENGDEIGRDIIRKALRQYVKRKGGKLPE